MPVNSFFVYVLYLAFIDRFYIGQTLNPEVRFEEHLQHAKPEAFTTRAEDWIIYYRLECKIRQQAILIERHIKHMKSRKYLKNLVEKPEIAEKLLERFQ